MGSEMNRAKQGISDSDNEFAGRVLLAGVVAVVGALVLAISPILIGGFLIGLIWYGAYMENGDANGEKVIWPIIITLAIFSYVFGLLPPINHYFEGVLFTDFGKWTSFQIGELLRFVNEMLPRKMTIHSVTVQQVRLYGWALNLAAVVAFIYLYMKGLERGTFLYRGVYRAFGPLRALAERWQVLVGATLAAVLWTWIFGSPGWVKSGGAITLALLWIYGLMNPKQSTNESATDREIIAGPIHLGYEKGHGHRKTTLTEEQLNHHVHIVGASGFGKSVLLSHVVKNRICSGRGLLFVDLKADFETIRQVVSNAKAAGRLDELQIFSCGNPEFSSPYNVIANGTANQLKDRIMGALNWSEEFYKNEAASFLLKLLRGLTAVRDAKGKPFDLQTILKCADEPGEISAIINDLPEADLETRAQLEGLVSHLGQRENKKALQGLKSQIESLLLSDFGHLLKANSKGIDLFDAIRNRKIVYVLLDSRTYGESSKALGKLILQDLKAASARIDNELARNERTPFSVVVDEFADLATEDFIGFLDRARSSKIGVVLAHQEIADLSRISPEFARRLMNATSTLFAFLQKLPDSSELIGGISGTRKAKEVTEQAKSNWLFGDEKTGMKSIKEVDEFVIHPNVIRSLPVGECVMVQKYPKAKSAVIKVKPEARDYLSDLEVKSALAEMGFKQQPQPKAVPVQIRTSSRTVSESRTKEQKGLSYWGDGIER